MRSFPETGTARRLSGEDEKPRFKASQPALIFPEFVEYWIIIHRLRIIQYSSGIGGKGLGQALPLADNSKTSLDQREMMENQHRFIQGYRELTEAEIELINRVKGAAEDVGKLCDEVHSHGDEIDQRWMAIGVTHLQQGFMAIVRGIAQPVTF